MKTIKEILCFHFDAESEESLNKAMRADRIDDIFLLGLVINELIDKRNNLIKEKREKDNDIQ